MGHLVIVSLDWMLFTWVILHVALEDTISPSALLSVFKLKTKPATAPRWLDTAILKIHSITAITVAHLTIFEHKQLHFHKDLDNFFSATNQKGLDQKNM